MIHSVQHIQALSTFKQKALNKKLSKSGVQLIGTEFVHFVHSEQVLDEAQSSTITTLLAYNQPLPNVQSVDTLVVIPRLGTISPWSSKATDILHLCGLEKVQRVERGIIYHFDKKITNKAAVLSIIMDKMTESALDTIDHAQSIFEHLAPRFSC